MVIIMKKYFAFLLTIIFCFFTACGNNITPKTNTTQLTATETANVRYNAVEAFYSNVILYQNGSYIGVLNNDGSIRLKAQYIGLEPISPDYLMYSNTSDGDINSVGLININGDKILPCEYSKITYIDNEYVLLMFYEKSESEELKANYIKYPNGDIYAPCYEIYSLKDNKKLTIDLSCYANMQKITAVENSFQILGVNGDNEAILTIYDKESGKLKCECENYTYLDSYYFTTVDGTDVNANGEYVSIDNICTWADIGKNDLIPCYIDNSLGYADKSGKLIIDYEYDNINEIYVFGENNIIPVSKNGYWGFIDKSGNVLCDFIYDDVARCGFVNGYCAVEMNGLWGYVNTKGEETVPPKYEIDDESYLIFKSENDTDMLVNPIDGTTQEYYNAVGTDTEQMYYVNIKNENGDYSYGLATHFSQLIDCKYDRYSSLSKDGKIYVGCSDNSYTIYTLG